MIALLWTLPSSASKEFQPLGVGVKFSALKESLWSLF